MSSIASPTSPDQSTPARAIRASAASILSAVAGFLPSSPADADVIRVLRQLITPGLYQLLRDPNVFMLHIKLPEEETPVISWNQQTREEIQQVRATHTTTKHNGLPSLT